MLARDVEQAAGNDDPADEPYSGGESDANQSAIGQLRFICPLCCPAVAIIRKLINNSFDILMTQIQLPSCPPLHPPRPQRLQSMLDLPLPYQMCVNATKPTL